MRSSQLSYRPVSRSLTFYHPLVRITALVLVELVGIEPATS